MPSYLKLKGLLVDVGYGVICKQLSSSQVISAFSSVTIRTRTLQSLEILLIRLLLFYFESNVHNNCAAKLNLLYLFPFFISDEEVCGTQLRHMIERWFLTIASQFIFLSSSRLLLEVEIY
uniref:Uncharacterized protein n=1 Tax=Setaria italica TaxID=4555 RepID=K3YKA1_SETIT